MVDVECETGERWTGAFSADYIESLTSKTGNYKALGTFARMLSGALDGTADSVFVDLLTARDLEQLRARKRGSTVPTDAPLPSDRRYLIVTYAAEFDRVHYPLPLDAETQPSRASLARQLRRCRARLQERQHQPKGDDADVPWAECARRLRASRAEADALRERVAQLERAPRQRSSSRSVKGRAAGALRAENARLRRELSARSASADGRAAARRVGAGIGGRAENYGSFTKRFSCISRRVPAVAAGPGPVARGAAAAAASTKSQRAAPAPLIVEVRQTDAAAASLSTARPVAGAARGARGRRLVRAARPLRPDAVPARPRSQTGGARGAPRRLGLAPPSCGYSSAGSRRSERSCASPPPPPKARVPKRRSASGRRGPRPPRPPSTAARAVPRCTGGARRGRGGARAAADRAVAPPSPAQAPAEAAPDDPPAAAPPAPKAPAPRAAPPPPAEPEPAAAPPPRAAFRPHRAAARGTAAEPAQPEPAAAPPPRAARRTVPPPAPPQPPSRPLHHNRSRPRRRRARAAVQKESVPREYLAAAAAEAVAVPAEEGRAPEEARPSRRCADRNAENVKTDATSATSTSGRTSLKAFLREAKSKPL